MVIVWGTSLYGKVDEVPGLCWVATQFFHVYYLPLVPMGSQAVVSQDGDGWQGAPVPLSGKSILAAWLRAACVVALLAAVIMFFVDDRGTQRLTTAALAIAGVGGLVFSYSSMFKRASYHRATQLADMLGVPDEVRIIVDLEYGKITEDEAAAALEECAKVREAEDAQKAAEMAEFKAKREAAKAEKEAQRAAAKAEKDKARAEGRKPAGGAVVAPKRRSLANRFD